MYVPNVEELKKDILDEVHISAYAMHPGSTKMYHTIHHFYYWPAFQEALGSRLLYNTAYHPQTDGQLERTIQTLEDMLRLSILQFGDAWHKCLPLIKCCAIRQERKLSPRYIGPYQIVERVREVAYQLALPLELARVHNVFHVSMLRKYVSDPSHVILPQPLEINPYLTYDEVPVTILDCKDKVLRNKTVRMVKVL
ncbi:uncharacterized protein [Malus domestica]|uniref:uncharacterized protein n=1 Tax=Malus domestica TaxID=3750 RepID=UPI0039752AE7